MEPITRSEMLMDGQYVEPKTRKEKILAGEDLEPITREEYFLKKYRHSGGDVDVVQLTATENKTYTAPEGKAYNPVKVNVPEPVLDSITINENGHFTPPAGTDGYDDITVYVPYVTQGTTINENGDYTPPSGVDGFGRVIVDVPLPQNAYLLESQKDDVVTIQHGAEFDMPKLIASIEPQQDLHGYDSPWVGGGGKNKLKDDLYYDRTLNGVTFARQADGGIKITGTATQNFRFNYSNTVALKTGQYILSGGATKVEVALQGFGYVTTNEKSITVESDATYEAWLYLYSGTAYNTTIYPMLRPSNTDSTFAPYSNECPISGWTACNVVRTSRNWFDEYLELGDIDGTTGQEMPSTTYLRSHYIYVDSSFTYYFRTPNTIRKWVYCYDVNKNIMDTSTVILGNTNSEFTLPQNCCYIRFLLNKDAYGSSTYQNDICINISDTSFNGQYEPFGNTYTINFVDGSNPLTVYGGTLDVLSGGLDDIQKSFTLDGTETISMGTSGGKTYFTASISSKIGGYSYNTSPTNKDLFTSSHFKGDNSINYGNFYITGGGGTIVFLVEGITSESAMKTWLTNNTPQFVVPLATPQTYQLTPTQVKSLLGVNSIYADTGEVDVQIWTKEV